MHIIHTDSSLNMQSVSEVIDLCADDSEDTAPVTTVTTTTSAATSVLNAVAAEKKRVKDAKKAAAAVSSSVPKVHCHLQYYYYPLVWLLTES